MKLFSTFLLFAALFFGTMFNTQAQKRKNNAATQSSAGTNRNSSEQLLIRKWQLDPVFLRAMLQKEADKMRATDPNQATNLEKFIDVYVEKMSAATVEFFRDGSFERIMENGSEKGKWSLEQNGKVFVQTDPAGNVEKSKIIELSASKLIIESQDGNGEKTQVSFIPAK